MAIGVCGFFDEDNYDDCDDYNDGLTMGIGIGTSDDRDWAKQRSEDYDRDCSLLGCKDD